MAKKITDEQIIQINEEYLLDPVKSHVAKKVGVSASTVSKYLIEGYISQKERIVQKTNHILPSVNDIDLGNDWGSICKLSENEWEELKELQKTILL